VETEGNTIDEAIERGLGMLGVSREQAQVEIVQDSRRSLLGFGGQKARVRVSLRDAPSSQPEPIPTNAAASSAPVSGGATTVLDELLKKMGFEARVEASSDQAEGQQHLQISSDSSGLLIGRHGQTLDALEYLVNRMMSRQDERGSRIIVDCEGYRDRRARELQEAASRLAERVRQRGKSQTMEPMSPRDRRIVHMALSSDTGVVTKSTGEGYFRRVVIAPARNARDSRQS
jgi:spoIIIJ-associated protein